MSVTKGKASNPIFDSAFKLDNECIFQLGVADKRFELKTLRIAKKCCYYQDTTNLILIT